MERSELAMGLDGQGEQSGPSLILTFERMPKVALDRFCGRIGAIEPLPEAPKVNVDAAIPQGAAFVVHVSFGGHALRLTGFGTPVPPEVLEHTVACSWIPEEQKQAILRHAAHVRCDYEGGSDDPTEQYVALYKVAWGFAEAGLTGILNEHAWTCQPAEALPRVVSPKALAQIRQRVPLMLWTGLVTIPHARGLWFVTRGHHLLGIPDFAYLGTDDSEAEAVVGMLRAILSHIHDTGAPVGPGDTVRLGDQEILRFEEVPAYLGLPHGEGRVLEIERAERSPLDPA